MFDWRCVGARGCVPWPLPPPRALLCFPAPLLSRSQYSCPLLLPPPAGAIEKLADMKLKAPATSMLLAVCEAVGPQFVALQLHKKAAAHKNPKVWKVWRCGWCGGLDQERTLL